MKILITGANGMLAKDLIQILENQRYLVVGKTHQDLDITNKDSVIKVLKQENPDIVIQCAAYTKVDDAENNLNLARKINAKGCEIVAKACNEIDSTMIYISTDYVFDGTSKEPYKTFFKKNPINIYGESKSRAEDAIIDEYYEKSYIVRTSTVIGKNGSNFIKTMLSLAENRDEVNVVSDQISSPTFTFDLAPMLIKIIESNEYGLYHVCNEGSVSKSDLVRASYKLMNIRTKVNDILTKDYPTPAKRPLYSVLNTQTIRARGYELLPPWDESLKIFLAR